ncbi:unnamed protein product, partial [Heligmosomoides polygyrus]|uniref:Protein virilizer homolog n=1 Tax=Heligmosomoides polygyrus TaxID=6339 RepID=A0A183GWW5_HELPZ
MADEVLMKCVPVSDDDVLDLGDYDEGEIEEESAGESDQGKETEEEDEANKPPTDEPKGQEAEEKEEVAPLSNDFTNLSVRLLDLVENIGIRQQLLLEGLREQTEDRLDRIEKKLKVYQMWTEYMLAALTDQAYGEEEEEELISAAGQPAT